MAKCTAHSSRTGQPCQKDAIKGGSVCRNHGGSAPQVRASAEARLRALVDPAIGVVESTLKQQKRPELALKAAHDVLDRNGHKQPEKVELSGAGGERLFDFSGVPMDDLKKLQTVLEAAMKENDSFRAREAQEEK